MASGRHASMAMGSGKRREGQPIWQIAHPCAPLASGFPSVEPVASPSCSGVMWDGSGPGGALLEPPCACASAQGGGRAANPVSLVDWPSFPALALPQAGPWPGLAPWRCSSVSSMSVSGPVVHASGWRGGNGASRAAEAAMVVVWLARIARMTLEINILTISHSFHFSFTSSKSGTASWR